MFFEKKGPVWDTLRALVRELDAAGIEYIVIGGIALNLHNYPRQTVDVDVVLTPSGFEEFKSRFAHSRFPPAVGKRNRYVDPQTEVSIDVRLAGRIAGNRRKNSTVRFPQPGKHELRDDVSTVSLADLIQLKLVTCGTRIGAMSWS